MNILPKKRWHVRTKDNIARVRKDEAAAREEERKKQEKLEFAESEARINFLRKRSGLPEKHSDAPESDEIKLSIHEEEPTSSGHVNLFADYKTHVKTTNKDLEKEKKEEQEKYEKQIGYLTYLGQDTNEALRLKSWYEIAPKRVDVGDEREVVEKDMKTKYNQDPLTLINALLPPEPKTETKATKIKRKRSQSPDLPKITNDISKDTKKHTKHKKERKKHKKEKHKKRHKDHKEKRRTSGDHSEEEALKKRLKLEQMRKERLRRELAEKERQDALLAPKESTKQAIDVAPTPRVVQKYNSQFNPELAKQNMN
ncbi:leukocyte receptor cluster member 1 homolog [Stomoxys calcitrans]|uniref:leukocyte receptor cluster member 1 homolog n=1 Tax=Stomoxys calcitrans TaxID=35570 RepID=UPI0027E365A0|nr:leukocyte receptor cluster member 1 homolog [Stomoxys calcitrans]